MDIKGQEIWYIYFVKLTASREKMRKVLENSFPLYEKAEAPFLSLSHTICVY